MTGIELVNVGKRFGGHWLFRDINLQINAGDKIVFVPIVIKGSIRVIRVNEDGREVFLYHIHPGQTCAMSLNCCRANQTGLNKPFWQGCE